jgi:hypothetical protein
MAVVVEAETFRQFQRWQQQCEEENYTLDIPIRTDRPNSFA